MKKTKIYLLYPNLIKDKGLAKKSMDSVKLMMKNSKYDIEFIEDGKKYEKAVAGAWNSLLKQVVGKDYDYLFILCNDGVFHKDILRYMVNFQINTGFDIVTAKCERDWDKWSQIAKVELKDTIIRTETEKKDPAIMMFRKGVLEKVGLADETFPREFVERDLLYRCRLAGFAWGQPNDVAMFHPPVSTTIGNDNKRLQRALWKYVLKWGGDADQERFYFPYNDINFDYSSL